MKSKLYLGIALACSAAAAILPVHSSAAPAEGASAEPQAAQEEAAAASQEAKDSPAVSTVQDAAPLNTFDMEGVVVTASRMPQAVTDVPANVSVITSQEIEDNHYDGLPEALSHTNGVVIERSTTGEQAIVKLNGDDRVLVLVDGKRVNSDQGLGADRASADLRMVPPMSMVERIEVVKGGASSLYGSDAVGGVINIITKKGQKGIHTTIDAAYGAWHQGDYRITNQGRVNDFSWVVSGSIARRDYFKTKEYTGKKIKMPNSDSDEGNVSLRLDYDLNKRDSLTLNYSHVNTEEGGYTSSTWDGKNFAPNGFYKRIQNSVDLTYNFKGGSKAPGFLRYYHTNKYNNFIEPSYGGEFEYKTNAVEYQNGWELGKDHILIAGLDWRETKSSNDANAYESEKLENTAAYIQDTWKIGKKWSVVPGLRLDHHNKYGTNWSPKIAVNFTPDKKNQAYASWGKVFKAPLADALFTDGPYTKGNPDLDPETGWTSTVGWNHDFNEKSSLGLSLFYSEIKDAIAWVDMGPHYQSQNFNRDKKRGLELNYKQQFDKHWALDAGMSFIHREIDDGSGSGFQKDNTYSAPNSYRLGIDYRNRGWFVGLNTSIVSGINEASLGNKHYALVDLNASYTFNDTFKVYLKGLNLTNQFYTLYSVSAPGHGRFIQAGVQISF